jgi:predicted flap endonuclease-1-like 5' DNA nuclease
MSKQISEIEGIGPVFAEKLKEAGVNTVEGLLEDGCTKSGRKKIAASSGIDESKILDWVNMADLFRIKGVGSEFSELLKAAGVDTVKELRNRNAANLHEALVKVQAEKKITRTVPGASQVEDFIDQAKNLEPKVTH